MLTFVVRRVLASVAVLLGASYLMYNIASLAGDPLADLRASSAPNREQLIASRTRLLDLDTPPPIRYFSWLRDLILHGDWGVNMQNRDVGGILENRLMSTLELIVVATILAIVVGLAVGIVSALRQYSGLDYAVTFMTFLFFSLPVFWVAVLLKEYGAIQFNDFLRDPTPSAIAIALIAVVAGVIAMAVIGGALRRRLLVFATAAVATGGVLVYVGASKLLINPRLGIIVVALLGVGIAFAVTELSVGIRRRNMLYGALITAGIGVVLYYPLQPLLDRATFLMIVILAAAALLVGAIVGYFTGGYDRGQSMRTSMLTALLTSGVLLTDRFMQSWDEYVNNSAIRGRPIATVGSRAPRLEGDFWINGIDIMTHLVLPVTALILVSLATHSRYARASMLEVMNQDFIRTARAKGLTERTVVMRHAFRNSLIPITTIIAFDFGGLIGGAVITETVFGRPGMGAMFLEAFRPALDINPIMAFFVVTGAAAVLANMLADLGYAALDPRIRV